MDSEGRAQVLIVDDDETRMLLDVFVKADGHRTALADDGASALRQARDLHPDLILLDVIMPDMDGFEVARRLKQDPATRTIPVIIVTALDDTASRARLKACGAEEVIGKPIDRWELSRLMHQMLLPYSMKNAGTTP